MSATGDTIPVIYANDEEFFDYCRIKGNDHTFVIQAIEGSYRQRQKLFDKKEAENLFKRETRNDALPHYIPCARLGSYFFMASFPKANREQLLIDVDNSYLSPWKNNKVPPGNSSKFNDIWKYELNNKCGFILSSTGRNCQFDQLKRKIFVRFEEETKQFSVVYQYVIEEKKLQKVTIDSTKPKRARTVISRNPSPPIVNTITSKTAPTIAAKRTMSVPPKQQEIPSKRMKETIDPQSPSKLQKNLEVEKRPLSQDNLGSSASPSNPFEDNISKLIKLRKNLDRGFHRNRNQCQIISPSDQQFHIHSRKVYDYAASREAMDADLNQFLEIYTSKFEEIQRNNIPLGNFGIREDNKEDVHPMVPEDDRERVTKMKEKQKERQSPNRVLISQQSFMASQMINEDTKDFPLMENHRR